MIGGDLYGPIDLQASFWVLAKDDGGDDELTQGQTCIEVRFPLFSDRGACKESLKVLCMCGGGEVLTPVSLICVPCVFGPLSRCAWRRRSRCAASGPTCSRRRTRRTCWPTSNRWSETGPRACNDHSETGGEGGEKRPSEDGKMVYNK